MASYKNDYNRHYCKYCDLILPKNAASIAQHERGQRHKRNVARFLRELRGSNGEDDSATTRELRRIEAATGLKFPRPTEGAQTSTTSARPPQAMQHQQHPQMKQQKSGYGEAEAEWDEQHIQVAVDTTGMTEEEALVAKGEAAPMPGEWTAVESPQSDHDDEGREGKKEPPEDDKEQQVRVEPEAKKARLDCDRGRGTDSDEEPRKAVLQVLQTNKDEEASAPEQRGAWAAGLDEDSDSDSSDEKPSTATFKRRRQPVAARRIQQEPSDSDDDDYNN